MPRLDEAAMRLDTFAEGVPVVLCDGQAWHLPVPMVGDFYFTRDAAGRTNARRGTAFGPGYDRLLDAYAACETGDAQTFALVDLAFDLLSRNYSLTFDDLRELIRMPAHGSPGRERAEAMFSEIEAVALGVAPKATPVG